MGSIGIQNNQINQISTFTNFLLIFLGRNRCDKNVKGSGKNNIMIQVTKFVFIFCQNL